MSSLIRNISRKWIKTLTDKTPTVKTLMIVLKSPELKQNFLQTCNI